MPLPDDLLVAVKAAETMLNNKSLGDLWQLLEMSTPCIAESNDDALKVELAGVWLHSSRLAFQFYGDYYASAADLDCLGSLFDSEVVLTEVVKHVENCRALAFICLSTHADFVNNTGEEARPDIIKILSGMTGENLAVEKNLSIEMLVNLLYGPAAYCLYRTDVAEDGELPAQLLRQNVPLLKTRTGTYADRTPTSPSIPTDMI